MEHDTRKLAYHHRGGDQPLIGGTLDAFVRSVAQRFPSHDAVVSIDQRRRVTYAELDAEVERTARGLLALGLERGDRLGLWSTDNLEWVVVQLATARIGVILVNINPAWRSAELEHALRAARVRTLVLIPSFRSSHYADIVRSVCPEADTASPATFAPAAFPELRHLVIYDPDDVDGTVRPAPAFTCWSELIDAGTTVPDDATTRRAAMLDADDPINIQFTSGTTGFPKPVMLTHHGILNNAFSVAEAMHFTEADRLCVPVPFYHCFGMVVSTLACLTHGAAIVIPAPHFDAGATLAAIASESCTAVHGVPAMFAAELDRPDFATYDLSSLRTGIMGGAPCPPALVRRVMGDMGCREILIAYGQTEASPVTHLTHPDDTIERRTETVGTNLPHQEVKIIDPERGDLCRTGEPGEICFRGYHVMRGYFELPVETRDAVDDAGWLHSGDLGTMDADGTLRITGRLKDMIIRGGENIYPAEIEATLVTHPDVAEIAVFGVPDPARGEAVAAWIRLRNGATPDEDTVRDFARERMAHFKVPEHIRFVDEFPRTVTGKIQKFRMRDEEAALREAEATPV
jgi:fatty-acyl-CoA synthase